MTQSQKDYAKSFISEHSAEYVLVPNLKSMLLEKFDVVTPIYPWATREGSSMSRHLHEGEYFRMIGLYPRRPKLVSPSGSMITVKLNHQILHGAECGKKLGIPIIAGCPLAKDFWELGSSPDCLWIKLEQRYKDDNEGVDIEIKIGKLKNLQSKKQVSSYIFQNKEDLLDYLIENSESMNIDNAILSVRDIKRASWESGFRGFLGLMSGYKPVYFLLK